MYTTRRLVKRFVKVTPTNHPRPELWAYQGFSYFRAGLSEIKSRLTLSGSIVSLVFPYSVTNLLITAPAAVRAFYSQFFLDVQQASCASDMRPRIEPRHIQEVVHAEEQTTEVVLNCVARCTKALWESSQLTSLVEPSLGVMRP